MKRNRCISSLTPGEGKQKLRHSSWQFRSKEQKLLLDDLWVTFGERVRAGAQRRGYRHPLP